MLDIGIVIPQLAKYGGAERVVVECVTRWQHMHQITIYATECDPEILREHGVKGKVKLVELSPFFDGPHAFLLNGTLLPKMWEQEVGDHQIYHTHLWPTHLIDRHPMVWFPHEPPRMLEDLRHGVPVDESTPSGPWQVHCYPKFTYDDVPTIAFEASLNTLSLFDKLGSPDRIVANSRQTAGHLERVYGKKISDVVYPGVNVFDFIHTSSEENVFLTVGQLWPHKRVKMIIEAIGLVDNVQLYVVGSGPEREKLERMTETLAIADRVSFLGSVSNQELKVLYARCLAVVFAAINEPFGIVPMEALAAGKPLIAVDEGGYTEIVDDSCALLVPARPTEIGNRIDYLRNNKDVARQMGAAGLEKVKACTWDRTSDELLRILCDTRDSWERRDDAVTVRENEVDPLPLFGVQYYCWYGDGAGSQHWNDNPRFGGVSDMPSTGYYASSDGSTIEQQLRALEDVGLDFAVLNLHIDSSGVNEYELAVINRVLCVAESVHSRLRFAVQICLYDCAERHLVGALTVIKKLCRTGRYLKLCDQPVLFVFWTGALDYNRPYIDLFREQSEMFLRIACSLRLYSSRDERHRTFDLFHGWSLFSPLELGSSAKWKTLWRQAYRSSDVGTIGLRILTVAPGYDDSHLRDPNREPNPYRVIDRQDGTTYRHTMDFALSFPDPPHMVLVSTFNEYHENTHIESSNRHGSLYMDMTKRFVEKARSKWGDYIHRT